MTQTGDFLFTPPSDDDMPVMPEWLVRGANAFAVHSLFHTMNLLDLMRHRSSERELDVEVLRDVRYAHSHHAQRLDVWRPASPASSPRPALLFVHGGGFRTMSKRTHWYFARTFARMGFVVFTVDYRMGPNHLFPEPLMDVASALGWIAAHGADYGADVQRMVFAGESAGANLVTALTALCATPDHQSAWMRDVFALDIMPRVLLPMCGVLQVSDPERHLRRGVSRLVMPPLRDAKRSYIGPQDKDTAHLLADPVRFFEQRQHFERELPRLMLNVGSLDPLVDDSQRLERAWPQHSELKVYRRSGHSFMAFMWTRNASACWDDVHAFLAKSRALPERESVAQIAA